MAHIMFSTLNRDLFRGTHRSYPSVKYPNIQMLVAQRIRITIARAKISDMLLLEVIKVVEEPSSEYQVVEIEAKPCGTCNTYNTIAIETTLEKAMTMCNARYYELKGCPVPDEEDILAYA